ncbi:hypothetical protein COY05_01675 [Candidatus Peregrinibacteria bacterium CG_4_10_14_0_2_um_filter_38_24]|nr:MAG: hypothetical protein COY05_01675 [Candidatus Peregrinibacteria bacterium CG_4_10_14_0_2_um_filter_38_24]
MSKTTWIKRALSRMSIVVMIISSIIASPSVSAAIAATDHFTIVSAGNATTMDSGSILVFTVGSYDSSNVAKAFTGADIVCMDMNSSSSLSPSTAVDVTAVGAGISLTGVGSGAMPYPQTPGTDISGTNNNAICFNVATGDDAANTVTLKATSSFNVFVWAPGAGINDSTPTYPGVDYMAITVGAAVGGADHLVADFGASTTAEVNEQKTVTITQVNSGGGTVSSALADVVIDTNAVTVAAGALSGVMESSANHAFGLYGIVKFTSAANTTAYYMASVLTTTTFKVMGGPSNVIYSNSNIMAASGVSAGVTVAVDPGDTITKDIASVVNVSGVTTLVPGDIVSLPGSGDGECGTRGYFSVVSAVNSGADSTVTVMGPVNGFASCATNAGNITKITVTDGTASDYTVSNGAVGSADGYIYSVGEVLTGNETTTVVTGKTLTAGTLSVVVVGSEEGTFIVTPYSPTVNVSSPTTDSLTVGSATNMTVNAYGPPTGQVGVPTMAPIDFFLSKDPSSLSFPLVNAVDSTFSLTSGGIAVAGSWGSHTETWGSNISYGVSFKPTTPFSSSTIYVASVTKAFAPSKGETDLVDGTTVWTFTFTTGAGGGAFVPGGGFTGALGGKVPPIAMMGYPMPGQWDVPTNTGCVTINFDRSMTAADLTTSNIYIKKVVSGALSETLPAGSPAVTIINSENNSVCISGYTYEASSEYCVVVENDVTSSTGDVLAGMPGSSSAGCGGSGNGFGFSDMGPFEEIFHTGTGTKTINASLMGTNLDAYKVGDAITAVPVGFVPRITFSGGLDSSTVNSTNVTLKKNGTVSTAGTVSYDSMNNAISFAPTSILSASTSYTFNVSTLVKSISNTAISSVTKTFTTGAADTNTVKDPDATTSIGKPRLVFADADDFGVSIQIDEPLNKTTAENKSYYTLKTCSAAIIAADGLSCTGGGGVTTVSVLSGVNIRYEREGNRVLIDGLTLTPGDGFYIGISTSVTDAAGNGFDATANKSWTGMVMDGSKFGNGGQGMFQQDTMTMGDFNIKDMAQNPVSAFPMNSMASKSTIYMIDMPVTTIIPLDGYIEFTFPVGTGVSGVLNDQYSPGNGDFNGPNTGTPTFKAGVTSSISTDTASSGAGSLANGIGYIAAARKVYVQLLAATQANDHLHIDLDGIVNPSEPKDYNTSGYSLAIKTFNSTGTLLESMTTMPYFISQAGTNTISGIVTSGGSGVNGVRVFLDSPSAGHQETSTALDAAGTVVEGSNNGEYIFSNLPNGNYHIFIQPQNVGGTDYSEGNYNLQNVTTAATQNITLTTQNGDNCATIPVSVNISNINSIGSLGTSDSIDIFGWNTSGSGGFAKSFTRLQVIDSVVTPVNVYACGVGMYNIGIGPSLPKGTFSAFPPMEWMPPQNQNVNIVTGNIGGVAMTTVAFTASAPDATISGIVKDSAGTAVKGGKVFADNTAGGFGGDAKIGSDGTFSIPVSSGKTYRVGIFIPGMPPGKDNTVKIVAGGNVYVNGSTTVSTGSTGANPFVVRMSLNSTTSLTVSGRVTDGTNTITGAGVWAHRTDSQRPPVNGFTDSSGNYILYLPEAGTWQLEANAPGLGFLGTKTLTVTDSSFTSQNFEPLSSTESGTISGTIDVPGTSDDSGVVVSAHNATGNFNMAVTAADGTYSFDVPIDAATYTVEMWTPTLGTLSKTTALVDEDETVTKNLGSLAAPATVSIALSEAVSDDTYVNLISTTGTGLEVKIPAGQTTATTTLLAGDYTLILDLPFDESGASLAGGAFNDTTSAVNFDGTGDDITITLPTLNTVTGTIAEGGVGVEGALVTITDPVTLDTFTVTTDENGDYTAKVPDGTYSVVAELTGYVATPEDMVITDTVANQDIVLDPADKTIAGTITDSVGDPVEGALVYATMNGGGVATAETDANGDYTMNVSDGIWNVKAVTDGTSESATALQANASTTDVSSADIQLPATAVTLADPTAATVSSSDSTAFADTDLSFNMTVPPSSVSADSTLAFAQTNELPTTPSADSFSKGVTITGSSTNDSTPVTSFDNDVKLAFEYTVAELATEGISTPGATDKIDVGYLNETTNNWTKMPTTTTYYDSTGGVIPYTTIDDYATLAAAVTAVDLTTISLTTSTGHLTTFAPIVSSGSTPPATPSGLSATAGDASVALSWTKNSEDDMLRYDIWENNVTEGVTSTLTQAACTVTPCTKTISSLTNGTAYSFQIIAVDTDGNSSAGSTAAAATPVAATVAPSGGGPVGIGSGSGSGNSKKKTTTETTETTTSTDATDTSTDASSATATTVTPLKDIAGHWAQTYVEDLYEKGIVSGADESHYNPDKPITRAEFTKIVVKMYDLPMQDAESVVSSFKDVKESQWYAAFIQAAYDKGIVSGYTDKTFNPNKPITRAEAMKIILSASGVTIEEPTADSKFKDVKKKDWFAKYVEYAAANGIVNGYEDGTFGHNKNITRGEVAKIASLMLKDNLVGIVMGILKN